MSEEIQWQPVTPVPPDAPPPKFWRRDFGDPIEVYEYRGPTGLLWCYICRYLTPEGKKEIHPRTYGYYNGKLGWATSAPRPLYGSHLLAQRPEAGVLVVEGEKAAEKARILFPDLIVLASMYGAKSPHHSDWTVLKGRIVTIWADNDPAGKKYAEAVARFCAAVGATSVRVVEIPEYM